MNAALWRHFSQVAGFATWPLISLSWVRHPGVGTLLAPDSCSWCRFSTHRTREIRAVRSSLDCEAGETSGTWNSRLSSESDNIFRGLGSAFEGPRTQQSMKCPLPRVGASGDKLMVDQDETSLNGGLVVAGGYPHSGKISSSFTKASLYSRLTSSFWKNLHWNIMHFWLAFFLKTINSSEFWTKLRMWKVSCFWTHRKQGSRQRTTWGCESLRPNSPKYFWPFRRNLIIFKD